MFRLDEGSEFEKLFNTFADIPEETVVLRLLRAFHANPDLDATGYFRNIAALLVATGLSYGSFRTENPVDVFFEYIRLSIIKAREESNLLESENDKKTNLKFCDDLRELLASADMNFRLAVLNHDTPQDETDAATILSSIRSI